MQAGGAPSILPGGMLECTRRLPLVRLLGHSMKLLGRSFRGTGLERREDVVRTSSPYYPRRKKEKNQTFQLKPGAGVVTLAGKGVPSTFPNTCPHCQLTFRYWGFVWELPILAQEGMPVGADCPPPSARKRFPASRVVLKGRIDKTEGRTKIGKREIVAAKKRGKVRRSG